MNEKSSSQDNKTGESKKTRNEKKKFKHLNTYCENLTKKAADGKLDMIIGRDQEINRVIQILSRRTKK